MRTRRHQEILAVRGRQESLQTIIIGRYIVFGYEIERGLIYTQGSEEISRWYKHGELEFGFVRIKGYIHRVIAWTIHTDMHRGLSDAREERWRAVKVSLEIPGFRGETSVGPGTASSSA